MSVRSTVLSLSRGILLRCSLCCELCLLLTAGCPSTEIVGDGNPNGDSSVDSNSTDGLIDAKIFTVDMQVMSYDTSDESTPQFASVGTLLFGTFPVDPLAVGYTVEFVRTDVTGQDFSGTWNANEPIADVFAIGAGAIEVGFWPGYVGGISGGEYFVRVLGGGCQSGASGDCRLGTDSTLASESTLREVRQHSTLTVTVEFE